MRAFMEWDETPALKRAVMVQFLGIIAKTRRAREAKSIECVRGSSSRSLMPEHSSCHPGGGLSRFGGTCRQTCRAGVASSTTLGQSCSNRPTFRNTNRFSGSPDQAFLENGYTDGQLVEYNDKLNRYRKELHDRKQPMP